MQPVTVQLSQRGVIVLPQSIRKAYNLKTGDILTLTDVGGAFVLSPRRSELDALADKIAQDLAQKGESLESILLALREEREKYGE
jgi:bifunctional DNA-binding transcriptional regulator/antitoxin component of YhaV-PrlF toxin-antitoxin module